MKHCYKHANNNCACEKKIKYFCSSEKNGNSKNSQRPYLPPLCTSTLAWVQSCKHLHFQCVGQIIIIHFLIIYTVLRAQL